MRDEDHEFLRRIGVTTARDSGAAEQPVDAPLIPDETPAEPATAEPATAKPATAEPATAEPARRWFTPWVAALFAAVTITATAITAATTALTGADNSPAPAHTRTVASAAPDPPAPPKFGQTDAPLPFTASADCPPGSTAAQSVADPHSTTPWICVISGAAPAGWTLTLDLARAYVITALSIVPGAINTQSAQGDPWLQHRVVSRVQWNFNDTDHTILTQTTGNVHGEAIQPVPKVLASKITMIVQETSRPPAQSPTTPPSAPLLAAPETLTPSEQPDQPDPSDGSFAVTLVKVIGHQAL